MFVLFLFTCLIIFYVFLFFYVLFDAFYINIYQINWSSMSIVTTLVFLVTYTSPHLYIQLTSWYITFAPLHLTSTSGSHNLQPPAPELEYQHLTSPHLTPSYLTSPHLTLPHLTFSPCETLLYACYLHHATTPTYTMLPHTYSMLYQPHHAYLYIYI